MKGKAIAGLVLGIIGVVLGFIPVASLIGLPLAIVGLILAVSGRKGLIDAGEPAGIGTAALVLGIIAVILTAIGFFTCGICVICASTGAGAAGLLNSFS